jgi:hypothetical protein
MKARRIAVNIAKLPELVSKTRAAPGCTRERGMAERSPNIICDDHHSDL